MTASYRKKALVLAGATLVVSPLAFFSYYGNLLPYLTSYMYFRRDQMSLYIDPLWSGTVFRCLAFVIMIFASPLEHQFGIRRCIAISLVVLNISIFTGFFTVREPLAFTIIFGAVQGSTVGVIYTLTLKLLLVTWGEKGGLALGVMSLGPAIGALVNIGITYGVINPNNKKADLRVGHNVYFSDASIIHNVPYVFLVVGSVVLFTTSLGLTLLLMGSSQQAEEAAETPDSSECNSVEELNLVGESISLSPINEKTKLCGPSEEDAFIGKIKPSYKPLTSATASDNKTQNDWQQNEDVNSLLTPVDMSSKQILKSRQFWCAWLCFLTFCHAVYIHMNLYKQYGQLAISNDLTLVTTGFFCTGGMVVTRPLIGLFIHRFGIRTTVIYICAGSSLFMSLMVLVIHIYPMLYPLLAVLEFLCVSPNAFVFGYLTSELFGKTHSASNLGLVCSGQILLIFLEPLFVQAIVHRFGWDWVFLSGSLASALATCAIIATA